MIFFAIFILLKGDVKLFIREGGAVNQLARRQDLDF
jgi:hypothetical protein